MNFERTGVRCVTQKARNLMACAATFLLAGSVCGMPPGDRFVILNQDGAEMQDGLMPDKESCEGIREYFFKVSRGGLTHFFVNPNAHNTTYDSKVWDPVWHRDPRLDSKKSLKHIETTRRLHEKGVDWVQTMIDACREQGVVPGISMRMNDVHNISDYAAWSCSKFWLDHPEYRRIPGKKTSRQWHDLAFDFAHKEVREHALALVREMLEKWDVDCFEFDWLRFPHNVSPEAERTRTGCPALTAFMREAKKAVDEIGARRGRRIIVNVRVAAMPDAAIGLGTDAVAWAKEGLVDWVSPCNFFGSADFDLPFGEWRDALSRANPKVRLIGGIDFAGVAREGYWRPQGFTDAEFRGYLERMLAAGVRDIETFNLFCPRGSVSHQPSIGTYVQRDGLADVDRWVYSQSRAYPVTYHDAIPEGYDRANRFPTDLTESRTFRISIGRAARPGSVAVMLAFDGSVGSSPKNLVSLNGASALACNEVSPSTWMKGFTATKCSCRVTFPVRALRDGENVIVVAEKKGFPNLTSCQLMLEGVGK